MTVDASTRMTSQRPYLLRAMYAWIADNGMTPHLQVDATRRGVVVPQHAVTGGMITLNVAARAVAKLDMGNEFISFTARFQGVSHDVLVPIGAVLMIYAKETGVGMSLPIEDDEMLDGASRGGDDDAPPPRRGNHLRVVK